jgi:transcriptional regulator with XRE-family HTH domain
MIQAFLKLKNITQADVARRIGVGKGPVSAVIRGYRRSERIEKQIAAMLGVNVSHLWLPSKRTHITFVSGRRVIRNGTSHASTPGRNKNNN